MTAPSSEIGAQLWRILPEIYRTRDEEAAGGSGDLSRFLDALGELLDLVRAMLDQRLADCFPDDPDDPAALASQPWLLPYLASLVDAAPVSPHEQGRRREVSDAIALRQTKGTRAGVERVAEAVAGKLEPGEEEGRTGVEIEVAEGWRLVATTPRVDTPLLPLAAYGLPDPMPEGEPPPSVAAAHPGLPAATVDVRRFRRAVRVRPGSPQARTSTFGTRNVVAWRIEGAHGVPCFPGSYDDTASRTVDTRTPAWDRGRIHPRHSLLFVAPPTGFFKPRRDESPAMPSESRTEDRRHSITRRVLDRVEVTAGSLRLRDCAVRELVVDVDGAGADDVLLDATGCLVETVTCNGRARFEYCTVLGEARFAAVDASDSIFAGDVEVTGGPSCFRYSRVPSGFAPAATTVHASTSEIPVFTAMAYCEGGEAKAGTGAFGEPGCGVLHPATPDAIRSGAEDGGEMGAFHRVAFSLETDAVVKKAAAHLPFGVRPVVVVDERLLQVPPRAQR